MVVKISGSNARITETPNAVMTTLASPTQGSTDVLSLWRTAMGPGQRGPLHTFDVEQVWHVLEGAAEVVVGVEPIAVEAGDTVVLPAGITRQMRSDTGVVFVVSGPASGQASSDGSDAVSPPWIV